MCLLTGGTVHCITISDTCLIHWSSSLEIISIAAFAPPTAVPSELTIIEGVTGTQRVICKNENFRDVDETWTFNGTTPRTANRKVLTLRNITQDDAGTYRCQLSFDGAEIEGAFVDFELTVYCE